MVRVILIYASSCYVYFRVPVVCFISIPVIYMYHKALGTSQRKYLKVLQLECLFRSDHELMVLISYYHIGLVATKPVFGVSDEVQFNLFCSATETS